MTRGVQCNALHCSSPRSLFSPTLTVAQALQAAKDAGFTVLHHEDIAHHPTCEVKWYVPKPKPPFTQCIYVTLGAGTRRSRAAACCTGCVTWRSPPPRLCVSCPVEQQRSTACSRRRRQRSSAGESRCVRRPLRAFVCDSRCDALSLTQDVFTPMYLIVMQKPLTAK